MPKHPVSDLLLHNFPENGVKFLLHNPGNLQDLIRLATRHKTLPELRCFDFARRTIEPDTLIRSDFSQGVTDLLVRLPFRASGDPSAWIKLRFEPRSWSPLPLWSQRRTSAASDVCNWVPPSPTTRNARVSAMNANHFQDGLHQPGRKSEKCLVKIIPGFLSE